VRLQGLEPVLAEEPQQVRAPEQVPEQVLELA
jgi:hypothetical protein